jgi:hypothetical protein
MVRRVVCAEQRGKKGYHARYGQSGEKEALGETTMRIDCLLS